MLKYAMQDKILLGFLMSGEKTGYEIKKRMEETTSFFFNTSLGSIYPAFTKLEKEQLVTLEKTKKNGRVKNIYSITEKGKEIFFQWLKEDAALSKIKDECLLKIFFFKHLEQDSRKTVLEDYIVQLDGFMNELQVIREKLISTKKEKKEYEHFEITPLDFGIDYYQYIMYWYKRYLDTGLYQGNGQESED